MSLILESRGRLAELHFYGAKVKNWGRRQEQDAYSHAQHFVLCTLCAYILCHVKVHQTLFVTVLACLTPRPTASLRWRTRTHTHTQSVCFAGFPRNMPCLCFLTAQTPVIENVLRCHAMFLRVFWCCPIEQVDATTMETEKYETKSVPCFAVSDCRANNFLQQENGETAQRCNK